MNTIEDAKKLRWILNVLQAKLPTNSAIKIKTEIACLDQEMSDEGNLLRYFDLNNIPFLWAEISCLESDAFCGITIVLTEKGISVRLKESVKDLKDKNGTTKIWDSFESFRVTLNGIYANILQYKPGGGPKMYANIFQYFYQKK